MRPYTRYPPTFDQDSGRGESSDGSSGNEDDNDDDDDDDDDRWSDFSYPKKESIGEGTASEGSQRQLSKSCETGLDIYLAQSAFTTSRVRRAVTLLVLRNMGDVLPCKEKNLVRYALKLLPVLFVILREEEEKEEEEEEQRRRAEENRDDRRERREEREEEDLELTAERVFTLHRITFLDSFTSESPHIRGGAMTCRTAEELRNSSLRSRVAECLPARYSTARKRKMRTMKRGLEVEKKKKEKEKEEEWETSAPYLRDPPKADRETERVGRRWRYLPGNWIGISFFTIVRGSGRR
uniref:Uncharacterized protein n=1 Tax=Vespula pensylvanica TaxID=30213 RepID=A0A834U9B5_VESPE|nr:hypothetical protein H0235_008677 [Vespula pensylvanica]